MPADRHSGPPLASHSSFTPEDEATPGIASSQIQQSQTTGDIAIQGDRNVVNIMNIHVSSGVPALAVEGLQTSTDIIRGKLSSVGWERVDASIVEETLRCIQANDFPFESVPNHNTSLIDPQTLLKTADALERTARFFADRCFIHFPCLLPYPRQAVLLAEAFHLMFREDETLEEHLEEWFWLTTYWETFRDADAACWQAERQYVRSLITDGRADWPKRPEPGTVSLPQQLEFSSPRAKTLLLRLIERQPVNLRGQFIDVRRLLATHGEGAVMRLLPAGRILPHRVSSPGNLLLAWPEEAEAVRRQLLQHCKKSDHQLLYRHVISEKAAAALASGDYETFLRIRQEELDQLELRFYQRWSPSPLHRAARELMTSTDAKHPIALHEIRRRLPIMLQAVSTSAVPEFVKDSLSGFFREYVGSPRAPVPFGGRDALLTDLLSWLQDSQSPPHAFICAETGVGKSALLAHFVTQVETQQLADVAFLPISIRFNTAQQSVALRLLAAQLRRIYREDLALPSDPQELAAEIYSYLRRGRSAGDPNLLLAVDGLDEALGWSFSEAAQRILPKWPGPGIKVLLSARILADRSESVWLAKLGLTESARPIALQRLDRQGIHEVLCSHSTKSAALANDPVLLRHLERLTQGDPLLLRLYVEELGPLQGNGTLFDASELSSIQAGLSGFLDRIWKDQNRQWGDQNPQTRAARQICNLLSCALGPLSSQDLPSLLGGGELEPSTLATLGSIVIRDREQVGYHFSHPRLREYFQEKLSAQEQTEWRQRFLDYGRETLHRLEQGGANLELTPSPYVIRYYGVHLALGRPDGEPENPEPLYALLSKSWLDAWWNLEKTYDGFLADVDRAWEAADTQAACSEPNASALSRAAVIGCQCALLHASVHSMAKGLPLKLLARLVRERLWSPARALSQVRRLANLDQIVSALRALQPLPTELLEDTVALIQSYRPNGREGILASYESAYASGLALLIPQLPHEEHAILIDDLLSLQRNSSWDIAITGLLSHLRRPLVRRVVAAARKIERPATRASVLARSVPLLRGREGAEILELVLRTIDELEASEYQVRLNLVSMLGLVLSTARRSEILESIWVQARDANLPAQTMASLLIGFLAQGQFLSQRTQMAVVSTALHLLKDGDSEGADSVFRTLAKPLTHHGAGRQVLAHLETSSKPNLKAEILPDLFPHLDETLRKQALRILRELPDRISSKAHALLVMQLPENESDREIAHLIEDFETDQAGQSFSVLAELIPQLGQRHVAQLWDVAIRKPVYAGFLVALAARVNAAEREKSLEQILARIDATELHYDEDRQRVHFIDDLAQLVSKNSLERLVSFAQRLSDGDAQAHLVSQCIAELVNSNDYDAAATLCQASDSYLTDAPGLRGLMWSNLLYSIGESARARFLLPARAVAHSVPGYYGGHIGAALIACLPVKERQAAITESLRLADQEPSALKRAEVRITLVRYASPEQQAGLISEILQVALDTRILNGRTPLHAQLYSAVVESGASPSVADVIYERLKEASGDYDWVQFHRQVARHLPEARVRATLTWTPTKKPGSPDTIDMLIPLIGRLAALGKVSDALASARAIDQQSSFYYREQALICLLPYLPEAERKALLSEIRSLIDAHTPKEIWYDRAFTLAWLAWFVEGDEKQQILAEVLELARSLTYNQHLLLVINAIARPLTQLPRTALVPLWTHLIHLLGQGDRSQLLKALALLLKPLRAVGGTATLPQLVSAVLEVGSWLP